MAIRYCWLRKTKQFGVMFSRVQGQRNRSRHNWYAAKFFFCECLNLVNVVGQIYFMDLFLGGEFTTYGSEVPCMVPVAPRCGG